ncbi:MAG TPA: porin, partial [Planctomycetaceae bacterium]|nr:porin [Planctomycetaceae bacterium]
MLLIGGCQLANGQTVSTAPTNNELVERINALEHANQQSQAKIAKLTEQQSKPAADKPKLPSVTINGVFQADAVTFDQNDASRLAYGTVENGADFRRARLSAKGAVTDRMDYFLQMDFGFFGRPTFTDVWADFKEAGPMGTVRVGQWKQPFGLETVSS